jgi:hypothetical protein
MRPFGFDLRVFLVVNRAKANILAFKELGLNIKHVASKQDKNGKRPQALPMTASESKRPLASAPWPSLGILRVS